MLIIPSVSIGNVPQLALDLLIYTYGFELVKSLDDSMLCPFIGPVDYIDANAKQRTGISTAAQLYKLNSHLLIQIRSPPLPGRKLEFLKSLSKELEGIHNGDVVIVGSANAGMNKSFDSEASGCISEVDTVVQLPDSGFTCEAIQTFIGSKALVMWVYEGDNFQESYVLARKLTEELGLPPVENYKQPVSWSRVYGKDAPFGLEEGLYT